MEENKFIVKDVTGVDKSKVEIEEQLLKKHEEKFEQEEVSQTEVSSESSVNDSDVLSYIKNRYDKDIESVDQLFETKESNEELPDDVSAYFNYKKETGRGIEDFVRLQKNFDNMDSKQILTEYYTSTEEGLDSEDIKDLIEDKFSYDEDFDDAKDIKKIQLAEKRELVKAKKFLNDQKDKYKVPLESSGNGLSDDDKEKVQ